MKAHSARYGLTTCVGSIAVSSAALLAGDGFATWMIILGGSALLGFVSGLVSMPD